MARILITGGAGYVGSHAAKALAAAGPEGVVFDNLSTGHREFVRWGPLREGDIRDAAALDAAFASRKFDAVMHFAALAYVGESVSQPGKYYDVNIAGTRAILEAMLRAGVGKFVLSSSCAVYGEPGSASIAEDTRPEPINPYGFTKLVCEHMLRDYGVAHGLKSIGLRYFNAAGGDPALEIGEDHDPEPHVIPLVLDAAMGRRASISIFGSDYPTPDGTAIRDYIHVCDLADAHVAAIDRLLAGADSDTFNLGTGKGASVAELIAAARAATGRDIPVIHAPRRPGDPARLVANPGKAASVIGWKATRSDLPTILADAWAWRRHRFGGRG